MLYEVITAQDPETKPRLPLPVVLKQERYDDSQDRALIVV